MVYDPGRFEAIEGKNSNRVRPENERSPRAFLSDYPEARATVVYRGERPLERSWNGSRLAGLSSVTCRLARMPITLKHWQVAA